MTAEKRRVLYVCHSHPAVTPGGAETYALELHTAFKETASFEPILLARTGPSLRPGTQAHDGTPLTPVNGEASQFFFHTDARDFDPLFGTLRDRQTYAQHFRDFLLAHKPDVVHFQHTLFLGYDWIREVRNTLPGAAIFYTLHEFMPICHRAGQMLREGRPCIESSPARCHECFPDVSTQDFFLRKRFIQSHLALVDLFLAPSQFLLDRYVEWGIPAEKIRLEEYGRLPAIAIEDDDEGRLPTRLGFFGQLAPHKGVLVLLQAMAILAERGCAAQLWLHGANLELQSKDFQRQFHEDLAAASGNVTNVGQYQPGDMAALMKSIDWVVVPSIWWENSPLVIQEAFQHGRPVICSDIGGMAEKVQHGVTGLHFRAGDPVSLADAIDKAVSVPGMWTRLHGRIQPVYGMRDHVGVLSSLYDSALARCPVGAQ